MPFAPLEPGPVEAAEEAVLQFQGRNAFRAIDHHWRENLFATAGAAVEVWSHERSEPVNTFSWGADAVLSVRFNPVRRQGPGSGRATARRVSLWRHDGGLREGVRWGCIMQKSLARPPASGPHGGLLSILQFVKTSLLRCTSSTAGRKYVQAFARSSCTAHAPLHCKLEVLC